MDYGLLTSFLVMMPLAIIILAFALPLKRKKTFALRYIIIFLIFLGVDYAIRQVNYPRYFDLGIYYLLAILAFHLLNSNRWIELIYCSIWSVFIFRLVSNSSRLFYHTFLAQYGLQHWMVIAGFSLYAIMVAVIIALTIGRFMPSGDSYNIGPRQFISTILLVMIFEFFDFVYLFNAELNTYKHLILGMQFYCVTIVYIQQILFNKSAIKTERDTLDYLWHHQQNQYVISKDNIDLINQKCHDLKHQIKYFRHHEMKSVSDEDLSFLKSIESAVDIYDAIVHTGNDVLDTILTEKSLYCQKNHINISCVADGAKLAFMAPVDIYSIFGNALDNAIESVIKLSDVDKRLVDVLVYQKNNFLVVSIINPIEDRPVFEGELPQSTKPKNGYHGFGLKSIRHTVKSYNGSLSVEVKEDKFKVTMLFPVYEEGNEAN